MKARKLLALTLALIMALGCMSITAFAEDNFVYVGDEYVITFSNSTLVENSIEQSKLTGNQINNIRVYDAQSLEIKSGPTQSGSDVVVTVKAKKATGLPYYCGLYYNNASGFDEVMLGNVSEIKEKTPQISYTAATTAPEMVAGTVGIYTLGTIAAENFAGTVSSYTVKVYTSATGTEESPGFIAEVDGGTLKITTDVSTKPGTYYVGVKGTYDTEEGELASRIPFTVYGAILDTEESATYSDTKSGIVQTYTVTVNEPKTDVTKVQVSWVLQDIDVTVTNNKIWNPDTLSWDVDNSKTNGAIASDPTATFNFVNLSSKDVYAKLTFTKDADITTEPTKAFTDNGAIGDGIIQLGNKATDSTTENTGTIALKLIVTDSDFDNAEEGTGTYGTYTVKISTSDPTEYTVTFDKKGGTGGTDSIKIVSGGTLSNIEPPTRDGFVFVGYFVELTQEKWYNNNGTPAKTDSITITTDMTLIATWGQIPQ